MKTAILFVILLMEANFAFAVEFQKGQVHRNKTTIEVTSSPANISVFNPSLSVGPGSKFEIISVLTDHYIVSFHKLYKVPYSIVSPMKEAELALAKAKLTEATKAEVPIAKAAEAASNEAAKAINAAEQAFIKVTSAEKIFNEAAVAAVAESGAAAALELLANAKEELTAAEAVLTEAKQAEILLIEKANAANSVLEKAQERIKLAEEEKEKAKNEKKMAEETAKSDPSKYMNLKYSDVVPDKHYFLNKKLLKGETVAIEDFTKPSFGELVSGPLIVPFKFRLNDKSLSGEATVGYYAGFGNDLFWENYQIGFTPILSAGLTQVTVASENTDGDIEEDSKTAFTWAAGFLFQSWDSVNIGLIYGQDRTGDSDWAHEGEGWVSLSVGWNLEN